MKAPVRMVDVAREAGVALSTVSLALNGDPRVRESTRARIEDVARRLRFRPNPLFAAIRTWRRRRREPSARIPIAYIEHLPAEERRGAVWKPLAERLAGGAVRAAELGYELRAVDTADLGDVRAWPRILRARGFAGVVFGNLHGFDPRAASWDHLGVVLTSDEDDPPFASLVEDRFGATLEALRRIALAGYRRVGCAVLRHEPVRPGDILRHAAAVEGLVRHGLGGVPVLDAPMGDQGAFAAWLEAWRPDCVLAFHAGVYWWMRDSGRRMPRDVGFACLSLSSNDARPLYGGTLDWSAEKPALAVERIDFLLRHGHLGRPAVPIRWMLPVRWIDGPTLRRRPAGAAPCRPRPGV